MYFATEDPTGYAKADRKWRQLGAVEGLLGIPGRLLKRGQARADDEAQTQNEELELARRLKTQTVDAQEAAKSTAEKDATPSPAAAGESPQEAQGRVVAAAGGSRVGRFLRRLFTDDPMQARRIRHIAEMKGQLAREGDIEKRLGAAGRFAPYTDDPGAMVSGVGGEELGMPVHDMHPAAKSQLAQDTSAARDALRAALGRQPTEGELTDKLNAIRETRLRKDEDIRLEERDKHPGGRGGSFETEKVGSGTEWVLEDAKEGEQREYDTSILTDNAAVGRLRKQHRKIRRINPKTIHRPLREGATAGGDEPSPAPPDDSGGGEVPDVLPGPVDDFETGVLFTRPVP